MSKKKFTRRLLNRVLHLIARQISGSEGLRLRLHRWRGVKIGSGVFIGDEVYLENEYPECIEIEDGAQISIRAVILAHTRGAGRVVIGKHAHIGPNSVIITSGGKTLRIGEGAVIGAGAVVTKDVENFIFVAPPALQRVAHVSTPLSQANRMEDFVRGLIPIKQKPVETTPAASSGNEDLDTEGANDHGS